MTMQKMANLLNLHETTISRAVANKYLQTPHGIFELKYFFSFGYDQPTGESISSKTIQEKIAQLIAQEDPNKPLSDQVLANKLSESPNGFKIARRTVTKYREALNILPTHLRRLHS
jgi:RNA polymerase sigma-54 factor